MSVIVLKSCRVNELDGICSFQISPPFHLSTSQFYYSALHRKCSTNLLRIIMILLLSSINHLTAMISNSLIWSAILCMQMRNLFELISNMTSKVSSLNSVKVALIFPNEIVLCETSAALRRINWFIRDIYNDKNLLSIRQWDCIIFFHSINAIEKSPNFLWKNRLDFWVKNIRFFSVILSLSTSLWKIRVLTLWLKSW